MGDAICRNRHFQGKMLKSMFTNYKYFNMRPQKILTGANKYFFPRIPGQQSKLNPTLEGRHRQECFQILPIGASRSASFAAFNVFFLRRFSPKRPRKWVEYWVTTQPKVEEMLLNAKIIF